ncbi:MAG: GNAT family N-acetyltransferase [Candidatus Dormiibacterota bacterium]
MSDPAHPAPPPALRREPPPEADVVLRDGTTVHVRGARPSDQAPLERFLSQLSEESRVLRFFSPVNDLGWAVRTFLDVDFVERSSLFAFRNDRIVGNGFYAQERPGRAEVALTIADEMQGQGLGTILLGHLAAYAAAAGIDEFTAEVLPQNHRMLGVFRESGFPIHSRSSYGVVTIEFPTSLEDGDDRFERRDQVASIAAIRRFLEPTAIAVIGASRRRGTLGGEVFHNLLTSGFGGPVLPISPHPVVQSVAAYADVREVTTRVDLAVILAPASDVVEIARQCAEKQVRALVVLSAGFAEIGEEGVARQDALLNVCRETGMRLVGPNCMGICSTTGDPSFNATAADQPPLPGRVGFMSQTGALALAVVDHTRRMGLGLSHVVSVGNKADISANDLLEFWENDPHTDVVVLYLESFGNPRRFSRLARRVARQKPVLVVKSARTPAGARASSTTGALLNESDVTLEALFRQSGVMRADSLGHLLDIANLLARQPPPTGRRVAILTNAGGLGILCADSCVAGGLEVPELSAAARERIAGALPTWARLHNPIDVTHEADAPTYERALGLLAGTGEFDAVIVLYIPPVASAAAGVEAAIERAARALAGRLPVLGVLMSRGADDPGHAVPRFEFPEDAASALAMVADWQAWREQPEESPWRFAQARDTEAQAILASALGRREYRLRQRTLAALFDCYGIQLLPYHLAGTPAEAAALAAPAVSETTPVVLRGLGPQILDRGLQGGIAFDLHSADDVLAVATEMQQRLAADGTPLDGYTVQEMVHGAAQLVLGVTQDPVFGPVLACGGGRSAADLTDLVITRLVPLAELEAQAVVEQLLSHPSLRWLADDRTVAARLRELVLRVSALAEDLPEVQELDLTPVLLTPGVVGVADARVRVGVPLPRPPAEARLRMP